ncbi:MAG: DUF819 family protein, partial [Verrucomicrobiota bacterium]
MNTPFIQPGDAWALWGFMIAGVAVCIYLEQNFSWAAKTSGPVLALLGGMLLSNLKLLPVESASYDLVDDYLVPVAIPLLLFRANVVKIFRESGPMLLAFHIAALGTVLGAFAAAALFHNAIDRAPEVTGVMTGSYIGGGVNFVAIKNSYQLDSNLTNPLLVADNFIMAGMFAVLFLISNSKFFRARFPHPHSAGVDQQESQVLAAHYWRRKEIALLDIALALAIAFVIAAGAMKVKSAVVAQTDSKLVQSLFGNAYVWITLFTAILTTLFHRVTERIHGAEELGGYLLYIFFFVIGLRADLWMVLRNVPVLFALCFVMAIVNLAFTLSI